MTASSASSALRVAIDDDACRGHGVCWSICPEVFELNDDGAGVVLLRDIPDELLDAVRDAAAQCPERAITISAAAG